MEKPDLEKLKIFCDCKTVPVEMILVRTIFDYKAIYQCTICNRQKEAWWRSFSRRLQISNREE